MLELLEKHCRKSALYAHEFKYGNIFLFKYRGFDKKVDWVDNKGGLFHTFSNIEKFEMFINSLSD